MGITGGQNDGRKPQKVDVEVDLESIERGGDDSVSSDVNGQDTLDTAGGGADVQKTLTAIRSDLSQIDLADRARVWSLLVSSKLFAEDPDGNMVLLQVDGNNDLIVRTRGVAVATNGTFDVTNATQTILAANAARRFATIVNDSDTTIYLALGAAAVVGSGIRINANGGQYTIDATNLYVGDIRAIHSAGVVNKRVTIVEG